MDIFQMIRNSATCWRVLPSKSFERRVKSLKNCKSASPILANKFWLNTWFCCYSWLNFTTYLAYSTNQRKIHFADHVSHINNSCLAHKNEMFINYQFKEHWGTFFCLINVLSHSPDDTAWKPYFRGNPW